MPDEPAVEFELELREVDMRRAYRWMFLRPRKSRKVLWLLWLFGFMIPFVYLALVSFSGLEFEISVLVITMILPALWVFAFIANEYLSRGYYKRNKLGQGVARYRFSKEGIRTKGQFFETSIGWGPYREAFETKHEYVLMISDGQFTLIPKRALPDTVAERNFKSLLTAHIPKVELGAADGVTPAIRSQ